MDIGTGRFRLGYWTQMDCSPKVIHITIVDKGAFNLFLMPGIYGDKRSLTIAPYVFVRKACLQAALCLNLHPYFY